MKKILFILGLLMATSVSAQLFTKAQAVAAGKTTEVALAETIALKTITALNNSDYAFFPNIFSIPLREEYDTNKVKMAWKRITNNQGKFQEIIDLKWQRKAEENSYLVGLQFENGKRDLKLSFDEAEKLTSFKFIAYQEVVSWQAPRYVDSSKFETKSLQIQSQFPLLAELTIPKEIENPTIVVLVHGSGPNDMNESLGPNKVFKDIAYGLASNGIGVLRYNKVSYDHQSKMVDYMNTITVDLEVTNDAVAALKVADSLTSGNLFLAGHSLGGYMAPKIAEQKKPEGVIVLAGNVSPLEDLIVDQLTYLKENDTNQNINDFMINSVKWQVENLKSGNYDSTASLGKLPLGLPASYWLSLKKYHPEQISVSQDIPYLILNGGRDYQVTSKQAKLWNNGNDHKLSNTIIYPKLNHLFYAGEGVLLPAEYEIESHFDEKVLTDIVEFINQVNAE